MLPAEAEMFPLLRRMPLSRFAVRHAREATGRRTAIVFDAGHLAFSRIRKPPAIMVISGGFRIRAAVAGGPK